MKDVMQIAFHSRSWPSLDVHLNQAITGSDILLYQAIAGLS